MNFPVEYALLIPTYNNEKTLEKVLLNCLDLVPAQQIFVINDGATDRTSEILAKYQETLNSIGYKQNKGKGYALRQGFTKAIECGYTHVITIDSDGQHYPSDIPNLLAASLENPNAVIMGSRNMKQESVPGKSSFGNKFSNFWFSLETGITLPDTQTGFRIYPLAPLKKLKLYTTKFETEIEVVVKMAWRNSPFIAIPIQVLYNPEERVSHFRPFRDFTRISILNTYLVCLTLLYYLPKRALKKFFSVSTWKQLWQNLSAPKESNFVVASSVGFGFFMGIIPIWGFQLLVGIPVAHFLKLNKVIFVSAANISIPPIIPFILFASYYVGGIFTPKPAPLPPLSELSLADIHINFIQYYLGACILAFAMATLTFGITFFAVTLFRKKNI